MASQGRLHAPSVSASHRACLRGRAVVCFAKPGTVGGGTTNGSSASGGLITASAGVLGNHFFRGACFISSVAESGVYSRGSQQNNDSKSDQHHTKQSLERSEWMCTYRAPQVRQRHQHGSGEKVGISCRKSDGGEAFCGKRVRCNAVVKMQSIPACSVAKLRLQTLLD